MSSLAADDNSDNLKDTLNDTAPFYDGQMRAEVTAQQGAKQQRGQLHQP